jgi:hypothetical protein
MMTYIQAIGIGFPAVQCSAIGDGSVYADLVWEAGDQIPSQVVLDTWIAANPTALVGTDITVLAFRNRFTQTEKVTIEMASLDNPSAPMAQRQLAASLRVMTADMNVASFIDLSRVDLIAGVTALETYGVIAAGRAAVILSTAITDKERPKS